MSRSSEYHLGASSSSLPFRQFGEFSEEEECDVIAKKKKKKATIEQQQQKLMAEGTPLQFENKQEGKKKEEYVTIEGKKEEEYVKIQEVGTPLQFQHNNLGSKKEEHVTVQGRKEEEDVTIQVEPDAPQLQMQGVAAQSSFNHYGPMADSESGIMSYAVLIILLVAAVILGLDFFGVI